MKKNVLALSITAALIGLTGGAHAMTGVLNGATAAATLTLNGDGVGHSLFIPYFSTQGGNATLINLVNTDTVNGKAVKVRFRGAANSDDIFDFQVFLSPGDVWAANISKDATTGLSTLTTADATCTKPLKATLSGAKFITSRLDVSKMTADQLANGTREGYVEIFNMGDIPKVAVVGATVADDTAATTAGLKAAAGDNPLYTAIKHVKSVAPCSGAAWDALDAADGVQATMSWSNVAAATTPRAYGLLSPTTGLMANWTIINTVNAAAWSGEAVAVQATAAGVAVKGNVVYFPQTAVPVGAATMATYSADPVLTEAADDGTSNALVAPNISAGNYDLPDMSTPYVAVSDATAVPPANQAITLTAAIAATAARNEFFTGATAAASTDLVFAMPTRRYAVAYDYADALIRQNINNTNYFNSNTFFVAGTVTKNTIVTTDTSSLGTNGNGRQICITGMSPQQYDREENTPTVVVGVPPVVISPSTPAVATVLSFCGEATVISINNGGIVSGGTGALKASVAVKDIDVTYPEGWLTMTTPAADTTLGLPVVGSNFVKASSSATQSFGSSAKHRFTR